METIQFDYDTIDGRNLEILAESDGTNIYFKIFDGEKRISKATLTQMDVNNIETFVRENSEPEIEYESDFYERSND